MPVKHGREFGEKFFPPGRRWRRQYRLAAAESRKERVWWPDTGPTPLNKGELLLCEKITV